MAGTYCFVYEAVSTIGRGIVMAEWIKIEKHTADKPEIHQMAQILALDPDAILGKLIRVWSWLDGVVHDGHAKSVTDVLIDRIAFCAGFTNALVDVNWLKSDEDGYSIPNFDRHMSKSAKKRALANERKKIERANRDKCHAESATPVAFRHDQRREEKSITPIVPKGTDKNDPSKPNPLYTEAFAEFWMAYPLKRGKLDAAKKFKRLKCSSILPEILLSITAHRGSAEWRKDGGEYVPNPATWLNQGRWEDEVENFAKKEARRHTRPAAFEGC